MDIAKTVAIVTGGASGLGEATTRMLIGAGGRVVILDRPGSTDEAAVAGAVKATLDRFGGVHVVVNCAGVGVAARVLSKEGPMSLGLFTKVIQVNLIGTFNVLRLAAAEMTRNEPNAEGERGVI